MKEKSRCIPAGSGQGAARLPDMAPLLLPARLLTLALGWVLGSPAPAPGPSAPALEATLRPGQCARLGNVTVCAPAIWGGVDGHTPDQTTLRLVRTGRAELSVPVDRGQRLAGPVYRLSAEPAVSQDARSRFTVQVPLPTELPRGRAVPAYLTALQVDAAPPHPGGSVLVWHTPDHLALPGSATFELGGLDEDGLIWTTFWQDAP